MIWVEWTATLLVLAGSAGADDERFVEALADCPRPVAFDVGSTEKGPPHIIIINPFRLDRPDAASMSRAYPPAARAAHVEGVSEVTCVIGVEGHPHDCTVASESPTGAGFGDAGVKVMQSLRFLPKRVDCQPVDGGRLTQKFHFSP